MKDNKFSLTKRLKSFVYAINGIKTLVKEEHNSWIHLLAAGIVIIGANYFKLNTFEWVAIIISIGVVFTAELVNTAIENIANFLTTENNNKIKIIKDLSAAAVLISALMSLIIGAIIFLPKILKLA